MLIATARRQSPSAFVKRLKITVSVVRSRPWAPPLRNDFDFIVLFRKKSHWTQKWDTIRALSVLCACHAAILVEAIGFGLGVNRRKIGTLCQMTCCRLSATERLSMDTKRRDAAARMAVTKLLRRFSDNLTTRLAAGTPEFWNRVEQRLAQKTPASEDKSRQP